MTIRPAANSTYPKGGVSFLGERFVDKTLIHNPNWFDNSPMRATQKQKPLY